MTKTMEVKIQVVRLKIADHVWG